MPHPITTIFGPSYAPPLQEDAPPASPVGSRRHRLWELDDHAHCPVVGVCLPMDLVRKLVGKVAGALAQDMDDHACHGLAVSESKRRSALAELIHKELDHRHALVLRQTARIKTTEALLAWWREQVDGPQLAPALWATLTHPQCTPALATQVLGHVHMLQHQVGAACRVDRARFEALMQENAVLTRQLAAAQARCTQQVSDHARKLAEAERAAMQARADTVSHCTRLAQLQDECEQLRQASPDLPARLALDRERRELTAQVQDLRRQLQQARQDAQQWLARCQAAEAARQLPLPQVAPAGLDPAERTAPSAAEALRDRTILCVGGRPATVPIYREVIEHTGGRFLHHDGGEEHSAAQLDATLAAADLVICQTGCVSHNAYWRVKDHCKRTGTRCVFVDTPSRSALSRALDQVAGQLPQRDTVSPG